MSIVIFGKGKVGMATDLTLKTEADFYDPQKGYVIEDFSKYNIAFICVSSLVHGPYDHVSIEDCLEKLHKSNFTGIVAIRCTLHPSFIKHWEYLYANLKIVHFPEFMKQGDEEYLDQPWIVVLGGKREHTERLGSWLIQHKYGTKDQLHYCTLVESALIKLHQNAGLALKVTYANMMYRACKEYGADFETVRLGATADARVGPAHTQVPGEHGFGFGGHCLPKDVRCLNATFPQHGFWNALIETNDHMRAYNDYK